LAIEHHVRGPLERRDLDAAAQLGLRKAVLLQLLDQHFLGLLIAFLGERVSRVDGSASLMSLISPDGSSSRPR